MHHTDRIYIPLILDMLFFFVAMAAWQAIAYAQCMPNDLNCMNLP